MAWGSVKEQDFVGKEAHLAQRASNPVAILCTLTVDDHASTAGVKRYMLGNEPVLTLEASRSSTRRGALVGDKRRHRAVDRQAHPARVPAV